MKKYFEQKTVGEIWIILWDWSVSLSRVESVEMQDSKKAGIDTPNYWYRLHTHIKQALDQRMQSIFPMLIYLFCILIRSALLNNIW